MSTSKDTDCLAPFEIWEVMLDNSTIKFHQPLVLKPEILPPEELGDRTYLTVDCPELNISAHADNRDDLLEFIHSDIRFTWKRCVQTENSDLSPKALARAKKIRDNFLAIAEAVNG